MSCAVSSSPAHADFLSAAKSACTWVDLAAIDRWPCVSTGCKAGCSLISENIREYGIKYQSNK